MEGVGSRLGRASSRYGPSTAAVFNGPVRKWRRKWVHVTPSRTTSSHHNAHSHFNSHNNGNNNNNNNNNNNSSRLLLFRWTPLSDVPSDDPPKRKHRYTPVVVVEEQKKAAKMVEKEAKISEAKQFTALQTSQNDDLNSDQALKKETQDATAGHLDLGLCLKGHDDPESASQKEDQMKKANPGGFWKLG